MLARPVSRIGRPSSYTPEIAAEIVNRITEGESLRAVCRLDHMPAAATVFQWLITKPDFAEQYAHARNALVERWSEEIVELADAEIPAGDNAAVQRARLRVDTRKWLMSKLAPKKYGDRVEHVVRAGAPEQLSDDELARIAAPAMLAVSASEINAPDLCTEIDEGNQ